jgi:hypothetical protein
MPVRLTAATVMAITIPGRMPARAGLAGTAIPGTLDRTPVRR